MPRLTLKSWAEYQEDYYSEDITRMRQICHRKGFEVTREDIAEAWGNYSRKFGAGWLTLPEDDEEIFLDLLEQLDEEVEEELVEEQVLAIAVKED